MSTIPTYDIRAFDWDAKYRVFTQEAWNLEWMDEEFHVSVFPNQKGPFYIKNYKTGEQRLFTYTGGEERGVWGFENEEDNILCLITVEPF